MCPCPYPLSPVRRIRPASPAVEQVLLQRRLPHVASPQSAQTLALAPIGLLPTAARVLFTVGSDFLRYRLPDDHLATAHARLWVSGGPARAHGRGTIGHVEGGDDAIAEEKDEALHGERHPEALRDKVKEQAREGCLDGFVARSHVVGRCLRCHSSDWRPRLHSLPGSCIAAAQLDS